MWVCPRWTLAAGILACGPTVAPAEDGSAGSSTEAGAAATDGGANETSTTTSGATSASSGATTSTASASSDDAGDDFVEDGGWCHCPPDLGSWPNGCDPIAQDCPFAEKCMPWANDGGAFWNATKCASVDPLPSQVGEPCVAQGSAVSGIDDCALGAMCWDVDPVTNEGVCVALCTGDPARPVCDDASLECAVLIEGVLPLCLPCCDPIAQSCADGDTCIPIGDDFVCVPDRSGPDLGGAGSPCELFDVCDPGLYCADADTVGGCDGAVGCCTPLCDLDAQDPCPGGEPGVECVSWWEGDIAPAGACHDATNVGVCKVVP
jgi:hypothetical protein